MKIPSILSTSILAVTAVILSNQSVQAGNSPVSFGDNDLLMAFRATATPGNTINVELNLGNADAYYNPGGNAPLDFSSAVGITNIGRLSLTDMNNTYGAAGAWATRTNLFWGIVGTSNASGSFDGWFAQNTIYLSRAQTTPGVQTTPWARQTSFNAANTQISSLNGNGGYEGNSTATSDFDVLVNAGNSNSYQTRSGGVPGATFGTVNGAFMNDSVVANFGTGTWLSVQDLFALEPGAGAGVYLGSFGLAADGTVAYSPTASYFAVPEPGTLTYLLGAMTAAALRRRRNRSAVRLTKAIAS